MRSVGASRERAPSIRNDRGRATTLGGGAKREPRARTRSRRDRPGAGTRSGRSSTRGRRCRGGGRSRMSKVAVIGAGSWGTTVAAIAAGNAPTTLWARRPELAAEIAAAHENPSYLPGVHLPDALHATGSLEEACAGADVIVLGVPSHGLRTVLAD